ncbi:hypothetical protein GCM10027570_34780 [Streptomonospora sediminis]
MADGLLQCQLRPLGPSDSHSRGAAVANRRATGGFGATPSYPQVLQQTPIPDPGTPGPSGYCKCAMGVSAAADTPIAFSGTGGAECVFRPRRGRGQES